MQDAQEICSEDLYELKLKLLTFNFCFIKSFSVQLFWKRTSLWHLYHCWGSTLSKILKIWTCVLVAQNTEWLIIFFVFTTSDINVFLLCWIFNLARNSFRMLNVFLSFCHQPPHYTLYFGKLIHFYGFKFYLWTWLPNQYLQFEFFHEPIVHLPVENSIYASQSQINSPSSPPTLALTQTKLSLAFLCLFRA